MSFCLLNFVGASVEAPQAECSTKKGGKKEAKYKNKTQTKQSQNLPRTQTRTSQDTHAHGTQRGHVLEQKGAPERAEVRWLARWAILETWLRLALRFEDNSIEKANDR